MAPLLLHSVYLGTSDVRIHFDKSYQKEGILLGRQRHAQSVGLQQLIVWDKMETDRRTVEAEQKLRLW